MITFLGRPCGAAIVLLHVLGLSGFSAHAVGTFHSADTDRDDLFSLRELLRVVQFYNAGAQHCEPESEDGFAVGTGDTACPEHDSDYAPVDWRVSLSELLRSIQVFNFGSYHPCQQGQDGYCLGDLPEGEGAVEGRAEGQSDGTNEGATDGVSEGAAEGGLEGLLEGLAEGYVEGHMEGSQEGTIEGVVEGQADGAAEGVTEGLNEGTSEGSAEGLFEGGPQEGFLEGTLEGTPQGEVEGVSEGASEGTGDGSPDGVIEGIAEGNLEGDAPEGSSEGHYEGSAEGVLEGAPEGAGEGNAEGETLSIHLINVEAATFQMGRPYDLQLATDEVPVHEVYLDAYQIGKFEVTVQQFVDVLNWAQARGLLQDYLGNTFSYNTLIYAYGKEVADTYGSNSASALGLELGVFTPRTRTGLNGVTYSMASHPVTRVSWYGAVLCCNWRSEMDGLDPVYDTTTWARLDPVPNGYRLPTEAEWERAAAWDGSRHWRFETTSDTIDLARANAWVTYRVNPLGLTEYPYTSPVGWFNGLNISPNRSTQTLDSTSPVGAYDMAGNVYELCEDWYAADYYSVSPTANPQGPVSGTAHVQRGGAWDFLEDDTRSSNRSFVSSTNRDDSTGFRMARTP